MVKNRHPRRPSPIPEVSFAPPPGTPAGIEVMSLETLRARVPGGRMPDAPQRPDFHHLLTLSSGTLRHTVDFDACELRPGDWLWVRPGQVQQWAGPLACEGTFVLFEPGFLDQETAAAARLDTSWGSPPVLRPEGARREALGSAAALLAAEFALPTAEAPAPATHAAVLRHLLSALALRLDWPAPRVPEEGATDGPYGTYLRFRAAVERDFARTRRVEDYARELGYAPRTLARAAYAAERVGAKELIDRRVLLEAKRLLAHSALPAAAVARRLGFRDAANFSAYFAKGTGTSPAAFRASVRGTAPAPSHDGPSQGETGGR
ncbi:AraC family transcriptional regulator [Streptomyces sp. ODS28]|uniref:AraC family transcriptional regulator n=1 Tax=Streptomyces sp. ODS28 TaxID=3136688 RepID=UPI0031EE479B